MHPNVKKVLRPKEPKYKGSREKPLITPDGSTAYDGRAVHRSLGMRHAGLGPSRKPAVDAGEVSRSAAIRTSDRTRFVGGNGMRTSGTDKRSSAPGMGFGPSGNPRGMSGKVLNVGEPGPGSHGTDSSHQNPRRRIVR